MLSVITKEYRLELTVRLLMGLTLLLWLLSPVSAQHPDGHPAEADTALEEPQPPGAPAAEEEFSLDDLDEEDGDEGSTEAPAPHPHAARAAGGHKPSYHFVTAVDFTLEHFKGEKQEVTFGFNHEYIILALQPKPRYRILFELMDRVFWEFNYTLTPAMSFKLGRIAIPFGPIPYHHILGGVVEKPTVGGGHVYNLLPQVWAEYGVGFKHRVIDTYAYGLDYQAWVVNGLQGDVKVADRTVDFTGATQERDNNLDKGVGLRIQNTFRGKYKANMTFYTSKWADDRLKEDGSLDEAFWEGDRMYLANADFEVGYNGIPLPVLRNFRFLYQYALIRTHSTQRTASVDNRVPWHTKSADVLQVVYNGFHKICDIQLRYGTYDDNWDFKSSKDQINYNIAFIFEVSSGIHVVPMLMRNYEMVNEKQDHFAFIKFFLEL